MSWQAMTAVSHHSAQTGDHLRFILHLAEFADAGGTIDPAPSQDTLADFFHVTVRTIRNWLGALYKAGELELVRAGRGPGSASAYRILLPIPEKAERKPETGGQIPETNPGNISGIEAQIAEMRAEIDALKAEVAALKAEKAEKNRLLFPVLEPEIPETKAERIPEIPERIPEKTGNISGKNRKGLSTESAHDPYLIRSDPLRGGNARARAEDAPSPDLLLAEMVNALAEVTVMDGHANWQTLSKTAGELLEVYTPAQIRTHYGRAAPPPDTWNWYLHDWRGQKGEPPDPGHILATIKRAISGAIPAMKKADKTAVPSAGLKQLAPGVY